MIHPLQILGEIRFGSETVSFTVNWRPRKTLAIHVYPDGRVVVDAPETASVEQVQAKVMKRAAWIMRQRRQFASCPPVLPKRRYIAGETHRYLGRQYRLQVAEGTEEGVKLEGGRLCVTARHVDNAARVKKLVTDWYRTRARTVFSARYEECLERAARAGIRHAGAWQLRYMNKRWGSCSRAGRITLNPELIAAPKECIDYVITHELCHLKEYSHNKAFFRLLGRVMPDWEERRRRLNELVEARFLKPGEV